MKGQGSLEYLIIIAAVLLITGVVVLVVTGSLGGQTSGYITNTCKQAASECKLAKLADPNAVCGSCDVSCKDPRTDTEIFSGAVACCRQGQPGSIYEGATTCGPALGAPTVAVATSQPANGDLAFSWDATDDTGLAKTVSTFRVPGDSSDTTVTCQISTTSASCTPTNFNTGCTVTDGGKKASCLWGGRPTAAGSFTFSTTATDLSGKTATDSKTITARGPGTISAAASPTCVVGGGTTSQITATTSTGTSGINIDFSIVSGSLSGGSVQSSVSPTSATTNAQGVATTTLTITSQVCGDSTDTKRCKAQVVATANNFGSSGILVSQRNPCTGTASPTEGATQACTTGGASGTQTYTNGAWGACIATVVGAKPEILFVYAKDINNDVDKFEYLYAKNCGWDTTAKTFSCASTGHVDAIGTYSASLSKIVGASPPTKGLGLKTSGGGSAFLDDKLISIAFDGTYGTAQNSNIYYDIWTGFDTTTPVISFTKGLLTCPALIPALSDPNYVAGRDECCADTNGWQQFGLCGLFNLGSIKQQYNICTVGFGNSKDTQACRLTTLTSKESCTTQVTTCYGTAYPETSYQWRRSNLDTADTYPLPYYGVADSSKMGDSSNLITFGSDNQGGGIAIGDLNGDGKTDIIFTTTQMRSAADDIHAFKVGWDCVTSSSTDWDASTNNPNNPDYAPLRCSAWSDFTLPGTGTAQSFGLGGTEWGGDVAMTTLKDTGGTSQKVVVFGSVDDPAGNGNNKLRFKVLKGLGKSTTANQLTYTAGSMSEASPIMPDLVHDIGFSFFDFNSDGNPEILVAVTEHTAAGSDKIKVVVGDSCTLDSNTALSCNWKADTSILSATLNSNIAGGDDTYSMGVVIKDLV